MPRRRYSREQPPRVRTAWARKAIQILSDGGWHDVEELRTQMQPLIPAQKALVTFDANWKPAVQPQPRRGRIEQGRRYIAVHTLGNLSKEAAIERKGRKYRALWPTAASAHVAG